MLLRVLFVAVLLSALAETIVHGVHALAQAAVHRRALIAVHEEIAAATTRASDAVAAAIAAGSDPRTVDPVPPPPVPACRLYTRRGCAIEGVATISFALPAVSASAVPSPCPSGACNSYAQENDTVDEGRIQARIAARAVAENGVPLAARVAYVTFRTWRDAPYVALAGESDGANAAVGGAFDLGDDGGTTSVGGAPGTLIDVVYENAFSKKTMPANVWRSRAQAARAKPEPWSP
jgi:hypothetical protein